MTARVPLLRGDVQVQVFAQQPPQEEATEQSLVDERERKITGLCVLALQNRVWQQVLEMESRTALQKQPRGDELAETDEEIVKEAKRGGEGQRE